MQYKYIFNIGVFVIICFCIIAFVKFEIDKNNFKFPELKYQSVNAKVLPIVKNPEETKIPVIITVYNPTIAQCDSTPFVTGNGSKIDAKHPQRWCAVNLDLYKKFKGEEIIIECDQAPVVNGAWRVMDCTGGSKNVVDILIPNPDVCRLEGCWSGFVIFKNN